MEEWKNLPESMLLRRISYRYQTKDGMDINVLRSKTSGMLEKELVAALIAYNLVRQLIYKAAQKGG
ncbi:MAG: hypothetical protein LBG15_14710, partial [Dysgonamonadaceae bacterium]|nr:hypothetical protein [Dysgonamonadaceae bacterium]